MLRGRHHARELTLVGECLANIRQVSCISWGLAARFARTFFGEIAESISPRKNG